MALFSGFRKAFHKSKSDFNVKPCATPRSRTINELTEFVDSDAAQHQQVNEQEEISASAEDVSSKMNDSSSINGIKVQIKQVSEEVCTIISLIPLLSTIEEGREMDDKIKQLDLRIQSMLAPLHYYTTTPAPMSANCDLWDLERKQINRIFESAVENFREAQRMIRLELVKLNSKKRF